MNLNLLNKMKTRIYDEVLFRQNEELINNKDIMNNRFLFAPLLSLFLLPALNRCSTPPISRQMKNNCQENSTV